MTHILAYFVGGMLALGVIFLWCIFISPALERWVNRRWP